MIDWELNLVLKFGDVNFKGCGFSGGEWVSWCCILVVVLYNWR